MNGKNEALTFWNGQENPNTPYNHSPKHARRDRKPATERHIPEVDPPLIPSENDRFRKRRLQDPLPLEENTRGRAQGRHTEKKEPLDSNINSVPVNPTHVPRSSSYFQVTFPFFSTIPYFLKRKLIHKFSLF